MPTNTTTHVGSCPRCDGAMTERGDEKLCLLCGHYDWSRVLVTEPSTKKWRDSVETIDAIRYGGVVPALKGVFLEVEMVDYSPQIKYKPVCPHDCSKRMRTLKKQGLPRGLSNYICPDKHRISIVSENGTQTWR